ncbi:hypothetical protein [Cryobacterium sp. Y11]|uniref:hypothetical protein n=1 Tax=Cryobacterium sp. Y11 TaxID=2045016 RepID=UPI0011B08BB0|nr:hypothetical protein [Cryobacterium sp. Y11]
MGALKRAPEISIWGPLLVFTPWFAASAAVAVLLSFAIVAGIGGSLLLTSGWGFQNQGNRYGSVVTPGFRNPVTWLLIPSFFVSFQWQFSN